MSSNAPALFQQAPSLRVPPGGEPGAGRHFYAVASMTKQLVFASLITLTSAGVGAAFCGPSVVSGQNGFALSFLTGILYLFLSLQVIVWPAGA